MRFLSHFLLVARPTQQKIDFLCSQMKLTPEQVEMCIQVDPSPNQTDFITWIARMLAKGHIRLPEDGERIKEQLITFNRLKKAPGFTGNKDINSYTPGTLFTVIEDNQGNFSKKEQNREKIREGASVIIRDGDILVYKVTKAPALAELSAGTNWCTAHENMGNTYLSSGPTYVIFDEGSAYAQFHPATNQLKDRTDTEIPDGIVSTSGNYRKTKKTVARFISDPICLKVISQLAKMGEPGVYKYLTGANDPKEKVEKAFAKHGDEVDNQLRKAVYDNQPLPQAELDEMFRKSYYGYNTSEPPSAKVYFRYCMKFMPGKSNERLEKLLLEGRPSLDLLSYCRKFLKGERWPDAEKKILTYATTSTNSMYLCLEYARGIIKGRWPEFEKLLLDRYSKHPDEWTKNQQWVDGYISLLSEITEDGEEVTDEDTGDKYHKQVRIATPPTWPEGEKRLATRDPNYEAIIVKEIQEAMASDEAVDPRSSNVEYNLYHAVEILYQYLKALKYFNTEWPEGVKFLNEVEDMRTKREGFWNTFNKFHLSSLLRRKSYALRDCL